MYKENEEKIKEEWMRSLLWGDLVTYFEDYEFKKKQKPFKTRKHLN